MRDLYRDYVTLSTEKKIHPASFTSYSNIFKNDFNISFFSPKKDQCWFCESFINSSPDKKKSKQESYNSHQKEKDMSLEEKKKDKAKISDNYKVFVYDLQAVLLFYYKSEINSYNFTITDLTCQNVECYFWHEGEAARGANEINSCLFNFLKETAEQSKENTNIVFYSDNCCGQQKNKFTISNYMYVLHKFDKIESIEHQFLVVGHTQNEGDNIHSVIEKAITRTLKSGPIYSPIQYASIIRGAKKTASRIRCTNSAMTIS